MQRLRFDAQRDCDSVSVSAIDAVVVDDVGGRYAVLVAGDQYQRALGRSEIGPRIRRYGGTRVMPIR